MRDQAVLLPIFNYYAHMQPTTTKEEGLEGVSFEDATPNVMTAPKFARLLQECGLVSAADDAQQVSAPEQYNFICGDRVCHTRS